MRYNLLLILFFHYFRRPLHTLIHYTLLHIIRSEKFIADVIFHLNKKHTTSSKHITQNPFRAHWPLGWLQKLSGKYSLLFFLLSFGFLFLFSSGTDCRVRRRMHAPFLGPYVSNFNPEKKVLSSFCFYAERDSTAFGITRVCYLCLWNFGYTNAYKKRKWQKVLCRVSKGVSQTVVLHKNRKFFLEFRNSFQLL